MNDPTLPKPPLGLVPKFIRDEQRLAEIDAVISRYVAAVKPIPVEWSDERSALCREEARPTPPAAVRDALALTLLHARHPDNPDAPFPMVRAGCADLLAEALLASPETADLFASVGTDRERGRRCFLSDHQGRIRDLEREVTDLLAQERGDDR